MWRAAVGPLAGDAESPAALLETCRRRIAEQDGALQAWKSVFDALPAISDAPVGPLHGIPVGIKDIIDVAGQQTLAGSAARANVAAAVTDANIVTRLRAAGAVILGKTHTTEFACFDPAPTRNPHDPARSPGGSSSGSAAAVAAGHVPLAIGTQTVASVNRPAAYCGICAFKPTPGCWSMEGIVPFAPSYDTLGIFARSLPEISHGAHALGLPDDRSDGDAQFMILEDPIYAAVDEEGARLFAGLADALGAQRFACPIDLAALNALHAEAIAFEAAQAHAEVFATRRAQLGPKLQSVLQRGSAISEARYRSVMTKIDAARSNFLASVPQDAVFLSPATPAPAPMREESTGDPRFIQPWTTIGAPTLSLPHAYASGQLPRGVVCAGYPGTDTKLLAAGDYVARALAG